MEDYEFGTVYRETRLCENCARCEMYNEDVALCSLREKWVNNIAATYCDFFIRDGGSNE